MYKELFKNYSAEKFQKDFDLLVECREKLHAARIEWEIDKFKKATSKTHNQYESNLTHIFGGLDDL